jgi:hypothetical protein
MTPLELVAAIRAEHDRTHADQSSRNVVKQLPRRRVGPMDVLHDEEQSPLARGQGEQCDHRLEQAQLRLRLVGALGGRRAGVELRKQVGQLASRRAEPDAELGRVVRGEVVADSLHERQIGQRQLRLGAASPHDLAAELSCPTGKLRREPRLAHPRFSGQQQEAALASVRGEQHVLESRKLVVATYDHRAERALKHAPDSVIASRTVSAGAERSPPAPAEGSLSPQ